MPGFGRSPFGHSPFGKSNYGSDTVTNVFPNSYLQKDGDGYLRRYLLTVENSFNKKRSEIDSMIDLVNPDKVRADILQHLGAMIGIELDQNEEEQFQRTLVRDAVQYYQIKGTDRSFQIRGLISGFNVEVLKIWKVGTEYVPFLPEDNVYEYPPGSGSASGIWYTDVAPENVSGVSGIDQYSDCRYCLTSYIKLNYTLRRLPSESVIGNLLDRVILKLREVIPIHVRDLFVDLTIEIQTDPLNAGAHLLIDELHEHPTSFSDRYDITCADVIPTDLHIPIVYNN